jgi:gliding motility-associated-like protein
MKSKLLSFAFCVCTAFVYASHVIGGNFVINQTGANTFSVKVVVFRDCSPGTLGMPTSITFGVYEKGTNIQQATYTVSSPVLSGVTLGDACYTPNNICVQQGIFSTNITIPNNTVGYYLQTQLFARNAIIDNIQNPGGTGMSYYAEIPNPAIAGMNTSPNFGAYPSDGYLCVNNTKFLNFGLTDPDGDSLVYSLVDPLDAPGSTNGTQPGPYAPITWQFPYSLANIAGGTVPMSINSSTGIITVNPNALGVFVFAVRVEEYRNGIKIGEVRRDVQYQALPCTTDSPPSFVNLQSSTSVYVNQNFCFDILSLDTNGSDTIYLEATSTNLALMNSYTSPVFSGGVYTYNNFQGGSNLSVNYYEVNAGVYSGIGQIPMRFCFTPQCSDLNQTYNLNLFSYSLGCNGSDTVDTDVTINVVSTLPDFQIELDDSVTVPYGDRICFDIRARDSINVNEDLYLIPLGSANNFTRYEPPIAGVINGQNVNYYTNFMNSGNDFIMNSFQQVGNGASAHVNTAVRYCLDADCELQKIENINFSYMSFSTACGSDTVYDNTVFHILPPKQGLNAIPNVFTPNNDGNNDFFSLNGISNPCEDFMNVNIFNRWGQMVYESDEIDFKWDGKNKKGHQMPEGIYFVVINGKYANKELSERYTLTLLK